jgi:curli biogenesis system outer membrane secretion channel CsgG
MQALGSERICFHLIELKSLHTAIANRRNLLREFPFSPSMSTKADQANRSCGTGRLVANPGAAGTWPRLRITHQCIESQKYMQKPQKPTVTFAKPRPDWNPRLFTVMALLGLGIAAQAKPDAGSKNAEMKPPTITVAKTGAEGIDSWQPAIGEGLAHMLITELTKLPNFTVLESVALDDLREERRLGEKGEVSDAESVKTGQWKGSDYTFKSTITRFGGNRRTVGGRGWVGNLPGVPGFIGRAGVGITTSEDEVQIDWRIVDNATRAIVVSGRGDGIEKGKSFNFSSWQGGGFSRNQEFRNSALGKATMKAIEQIVEEVRKIDLAAGGRTVNDEAATAASAAALRNVKGEVKYANGKEIWISLGSNQGFKEGDKVNIYKSIEKKNKKGEVIATDYEPVTEITLLKVQKDKSMAEYTGAAAIEEGWPAAGASVDIAKLN